jgi:regulator of chromosome condensation
MVPPPLTVLEGGSGRMGLSETNALLREEARLESRPVRIPQLEKITRLAAGGNHMLAIDQGGRMFAWGCGQQMQLGRRLVSRRELRCLTPMRIGNSRTKFVSIAAGADHSFATDNKGRVYGWGLNNYGQTGHPSEDGGGQLIVGYPAVIASLEGYDIRGIDGGTHHSIACTTDGELLVWGRCDDGQLGIPLEGLNPKHLILDSRGRPRILSRPARVPGQSFPAPHGESDWCLY